MKKLRAFKAEMSMRMAGFIAQNHSNPIAAALASLLASLNRGRYGKEALDFLDHEDSIDHLDYFDEDE